MSTKKQAAKPAAKKETPAAPVPANAPTAAAAVAAANAAPAEGQDVAYAVDLVRAKMRSQIEIYAPFNQSRAAAIETLTAVLVEFEAAVRADERAKFEAPAALTPETPAVASVVEHLHQAGTPVDAASLPPVVNFDSTTPGAEVSGVEVTHASVGNDANGSPVADAPSSAGE